MIERILLALATILAFTALIWGWTEFNGWAEPSGGPFTLIIAAFACVGWWAVHAETRTG